MNFPVQMGDFNILGKMLFYMGLNILTSLADKGTWGRALQLIKLFDPINIYLPHNAEYFLLAAEIYLVNEQALKAYELLKREFIFTDRFF